MWKFRRIGDYYELLDGTETLYLCKRLDSIMIATLEDLCARHNAEIAKYDELDKTERGVAGLGSTGV